MADRSDGFESPQPVFRPRAGATMLSRNFKNSAQRMSPVCPAVCPAVTTRLHFTDVFVKTSAAWKVVASHATEIRDVR